MEISIEKSKIVVNNVKEHIPTNIKINGEKKIVNTYKYLGSERSGWVGLAMIV